MFLYGLFSKIACRLHSGIEQTDKSAAETVTDIFNQIVQFLIENISQIDVCCLQRSLPLPIVMGLPFT
jgi:hypothetical protein